MNELLLRSLSVLHSVVSESTLPVDVSKRIMLKMEEIVHLVDNELTLQMTMTKDDKGDNLVNEDPIVSEEIHLISDKGTTSPDESDAVNESKHRVPESLTGTARQSQYPCGLSHWRHMIFQNALVFAAVLPIVDNAEDASFGQSKCGTESYLSDSVTAIKKAKNSRLETADQIVEQLEVNHWNPPSLFGFVNWNEHMMKKLKQLVMKHCGGPQPAIDWSAVARGMKLDPAVCKWKWSELCAIKRG